MGVADHLGIDLDEYDEKIRTFVPHYETMLGEIARAVADRGQATPTVIDLGIGTGAVTAACLAAVPAARVVGVDADAPMLDAARLRLRGHANVELRQGSFLEVPLPRADAVVACIALHHVANAEAKQALYRRIHDALQPGGVIVSGDCFPSEDLARADEQRRAWLTHLERSYSSEEAERLMRSWADEDTYVPLSTELGWLSAAGFATEVRWRADGFAVVAGTRAADASTRSS